MLNQQTSKKRSGKSEKSEKKQRDHRDKDREQHREHRARDSEKERRHRNHKSYREKKHREKSEESSSSTEEEIQVILDENTEGNTDENTEGNTEENTEGNEEQRTIGFLFVYEANGIFYTKLDDIAKTDGRMILIHPVYYEGYDNNMKSEEVVYDQDKDKYITGSDDGSWMDIIYGYPDSTYFMELGEVFNYNSRLYHCDGCLLYSLTKNNISIIKLK